MHTATTLPTLSFRFLDRIEVQLFGRPRDWSTQSLTASSDLYLRINVIAQRAGVERLLCPFPTFNAHICGINDLRMSIQNLGPEHEGVAILRGCDADGVELPLDEGVRNGYWLSSGDCPCLIVHTPYRRVICAHAGGRCVFNEALVLSGKQTRRYESIVDAIAFRLGDEIKESEFFITTGVCGEHFRHPWSDPWYGSHNRKITEYLINKWGRDCVIGNASEGKWWLHRVIREQLMSAGARPENIRVDDVCTYSDADPDMGPEWWSYERAVAEKNGLEHCRNGVFVFRT